MASLGHPRKFQRVSSSGRQPNFAALNRGRHLYSAGRPSRWALAHILVTLVFCLVPCGRLSWLFASFWAHVNILHCLSFIVSNCQFAVALPRTPLRHLTALPNFLSWWGGEHRLHQKSTPLGPSKFALRPLGASSLPWTLTLS